MNIDEFINQVFSKALSLKPPVVVTDRYIVENYNENQICSTKSRLNNETKVIYLREMNLGTIPQWIFEIEGLEGLLLDKNPNLNVTPKDISNLNSLKVLGLMQTNIKNFTFLKEAYTLEALDISVNYLDIFPEEICILKELRYLDVSSFNSFISIPKCINNAINLRSLRIHYNEIKSLPEEIGHLENLEQLILGGNQLEHIPNSIYNLKTLRELDLSVNNIREIDFRSLSNIKDLDEIFILKNPLENLPDDLLSQCKGVLSATCLRKYFSIALSNDDYSNKSNNKREYSSSNCNKDEIYKSLSQLHRDAGEFTDWSNDVKVKVKELLKNEAPKIIKDLENKMGVKIDPDEVIKDLYKYYGWSEEFNDTLEGYVKLGLKHYSSDQKKIISCTVAATLPRLSIRDPYSEDLMHLRIANAFCIKIQKGGYLIGISTQLSKIILDWSTLTASTVVGKPNKNANENSLMASKMAKMMGMGDLRFNISSLDMLDGYAKLIETRWIKGETPPTHKIGYMPEDVSKDIQWLYLQQNCMEVLHLFFIHHELAHAVLGHLSNANEIDIEINNESYLYLEKNHQQEFEADILATRTICKIYKERIKDDPSYLGMAEYSFLKLISFFYFMDLLDKYNEDNIATHPNSIERTHHITTVIQEEFPSFSTKLMMLPMSANPQNQSIERRINGIFK